MPDNDDVLTAADFVAAEMDPRDVINQMVRVENRGHSYTGHLAGWKVEQRDRRPVVTVYLSHAGSVTLDPDSARVLFVPVRRY